MSSELKETLKQRLDENYTAFIGSLQGKTVSELIAMAPEITAAQQLHEELLDACDDEDVEYLLRFDDPLELVRGYWEAALTGYDHGEEMRHMLWEIRDRELIEEESQPQKPRMELLGQDGNIFGILGQASRLLKRAGMKEQADEMFSRVTACGDYNKALNIISEYVETELSPTNPEPKKSQKKKGTPAYER